MSVHARTVLAGVLLATAAAIGLLVDFGAVEEARWSEVLRLRIDPSMSSVLPEGDPGSIYHDRMRAIFGNDETLLVAIRHPAGVFSPAVLAALKRATDRIESLPGIRSVTSLANAPNIRSEDGDMVIAPLFDEPPQDPEEIQRIRDDLRENPVLADSLLSEDGSTTAIVGYLLDMTELEFMAQALDRQMVKIAREEFGAQADVWLSGGAHVKAETQRLLLSDLLFIMPLCVVALMAIAFVSFGTLRGVLLPLLTLGIAIVWTLAFAVVFFPKLNIVTSSVPAILLGVGFAYAIHVLSAYYEVLGEHEGRRGDVSAATEAVHRVGLATLLTGLTTGVGFLSLAVSPIGAIKEFGLLCGVGVGFLMVSTLTFAPAVLHLLPEKLPRRSADRRESDWIERLLERIGRVVVARRLWVLGIGAGLAGASLASMSLIEISTNVLDNFPEDLSVRRSIAAINEHLGAADQLYVVLETDYRNAFKEPQNLELVAGLQRWLAEQPEVGGSTSVADYVKLINRGFHDNDPAEFRIPESKRLVSQLLFFGANDQVKRLVDSQYQIASIPVRVNVFNSTDVMGFVERLEAHLDELPQRIEGTVTGLSVLLAKTNDDIAYGQALSLSSAFVIIYVILAVLFMSPRIGFMAMLPNVLPVVIYFGTLGWAGVTLNVVTGLVACLVLGIAVDDTIHFLTRFNALAKEKADEGAGARAALLEVGRPVTYTTAALCAAFFVLTASTLQQQVEFGALAAFTLAVAWVVDLTFTPALASGLRIVTLWDVVGTDLGREPHKAIPLFHGLTGTQARLVALITRLVEYPKGHKLMEVGQKSDGMYVIIDGTLRSSVDKAGEVIALNQHKRGDLLGEVGVFRGERSANVECETDVRLIRIDEPGLEQLQRRYPRIGAQVYHNLSRILADRLVTATERLR